MNILTRTTRGIVKISLFQPEEFQNTVRLFRLNSFVKDTGRKEDAEAEPERQQWDDPMEFLMSCISMSVGQLPTVIGVSVHGRNLQHLAFVGVSFSSAIVYGP